MKPRPLFLGSFCKRRLRVTLALKVSSGNECVSNTRHNITTTLLKLILFFKKNNNYKWHQHLMVLCRMCIGMEIILDIKTCLI